MLTMIPLHSNRSDHYPYKNRRQEFKDYLQQNQFQHQIEKLVEILKMPLVRTMNKTTQQGLQIMAGEILLEMLDNKNLYLILKNRLQWFRRFKVLKKFKAPV